MQALLALAEAQSIPVAHTMSGKGGIACTHPLIGRALRPLFADRQRADRGLGLPARRRLQARRDRDQALCAAAAHDPDRSISKSSPRRSAAAFRPRWRCGATPAPGSRTWPRRSPTTAARRRAARADYVGEIPSRMQAWAEEAAPRLDSARAADPHGAAVPRAEPGAAGRHRILVADGGFAGHWTGLLYDTKIAGPAFHPGPRASPRSATGCRAGSARRWRRRRRPVVAITGDGGFNMMLGELETARRAGLGLTIVVVNNAASGYVKALQHAMIGGRYQSADLVEMDYAAIARAMGCGGIRVEDPEALGAALAAGHGRARPPDRARRRRHPRPRPDAPRRRQPHRRDQTGRPGRLTPSRVDVE